jgi:glycopeptide antibiotics resistance protein
VYGSLYPFAGWRPPREGVIASIFENQLPSYSISDALVNVVAYVPLGALLTGCLPDRWRAWRVPLTTVLLAVLSLTMEVTQTWLPTRVPSGMDLTLNTLGGAIGAITWATVLALLPSPTALADIRHRVIRDNAFARVALVATALWLGAQWSPFAPAFSPADVWHAVRPVWFALKDTHLDAAKTLRYVLQLSAVGLLITGALRNPCDGVRVTALVLLTGIVGNTLIVTQSVAAEHLLGVGVALLVVALLQGPRMESRAFLALASLAVGTALADTGFALRDSPRAFNWIPLKGQLDNPLLGIDDMLDTAWPYCAAAAFVVGERRPRLRTFIVGGLFVIAFAAAIEWAQRWEIHRYPDISDVLLAFMGWTAGYLSARHAQEPTSNPRRAFREAREKARPGESRDRA